MDTGFEIREMDLKGIFLVSAFLAQCWKYSYRNLLNDDYLLTIEDSHWVEFLSKKLLDKTAQGYIAEVDHKITGVSIFGKSITERFPNDGEIISLYIDKEFIGKGQGHLLLEKSLAKLKNDGYGDCLICVFAANERAVEFYEAHGFLKAARDEIIAIGRQELPYSIMRKSLIT